jgi:hypothetical protein
MKNNLFHPFWSMIPIWSIPCLIDTLQAEFFGLNEGQTWGVGHYLFSKSKKTHKSSAWVNDWSINLQSSHPFLAWTDQPS